jgi:alkaline phosphatase D
LVGGAESRALSREVSAETDFTGELVVEGLEPNTLYEVRMWIGGAGQGPHALPSSARRGTFRTPPLPSERSAVRLAWGGDLGGQNVCRTVAHGYPIFEAIEQQPLDLFLSLGDMIYSDDVCRSENLWGDPQVAGDPEPARTLEAFRARWRYLHADAGWRALLARTPWVSTWDDHEVVNDFGPDQDYRTDPPFRGERLMEIGRRAYLEYAPLGEELTATPARIYRSLHWGAHAELFVLDTRQYRSSNAAPDDAASAKSMLGRAQREWLVSALRGSRATWKLVASSVPLVIPTGHAGMRDGWAQHQTSTGFERELKSILRELASARVKNVIFLAADAHFASVFRHRPFADLPEFVFHEAVTGPLNAGLFNTQEFADTLRSERLFYWAPTQGWPKTFDEARRFFNVGLLEIRASGELTLSIRNALGAQIYALELAPG